MEKISPPIPGPPPVIPRGWTTVIFFFVVPALLIVGYITFDRIADSLDLPPELQPYATLEGTRAQIKGNAPAIPDTQALTAQDVGLFLHVVGRVRSGWDAVKAGIDSARRLTPAATPLAIWRNTALLRSLTLSPARARYGLAQILNGAGYSWEGYMRLKERVIAASGITPAQADSAYRACYRIYFATSDTTWIIGTKGMRDLFARAERVRLPAAVAASDAALAAPSRAVILSDGIPCLLDLENMFGE